MGLNLVILLDEGEEMTNRISLSKGSWLTFFEPDAEIEPEKSYRAVRHDVVRTRQRKASVDTRHPNEKRQMIRRVLDGKSDLQILDLFAGDGNCTRVYSEYGSVIANDKVGKVHKKLVENTEELESVECIRKDSFIYFHELISLKKKFDVIDVDPYGFPNRFFPDIFLLIDDGHLFLTMPKPSVNILNGITQAHLTSYFGCPNPSLDEILERIALWGLCHWREVSLIERQDLKSVWRLCFEVKRVKATEYTGVRNR